MAKKTVESEIIEPQDEPVAESITQEPVASLYPNAFYEASGIPYCRQCGECQRVDLYNQPLCPVGAPGCNGVTP